MVRNKFFYYLCHSRIICLIWFTKKPPKTQENPIFRFLKNLELEPCILFVIFFFSNLLLFHHFRSFFLFSFLLSHTVVVTRIDSIRSRVKSQLIICWFSRFCHQSTGLAMHYLFDVRMVYPIFFFLFEQQNKNTVRQHMAPTFWVQFWFSEKYNN